MEDVKTFVSIQLAAITVNAMLEGHWSTAHSAMVIIPSDHIIWQLSILISQNVRMVIFVLSEGKSLLKAE